MLGMTPGVMSVPPLLADPGNAHPTVSIWRHAAGASAAAQTPGRHVGSPHRLWGAATLRMARCFGTREPVRLRFAPILDWQRSSFPPSGVGLKGTADASTARAWAGSRLRSDLLDHTAFLKACLCLLGMPLSPSTVSSGRNKAAGIRSTAGKISCLHAENQNPRL